MRLKVWDKDGRIHRNLKGCQFNALSEELQQEVIAYIKSKYDAKGYMTEIIEEGATDKAE